MDVNLTKLTMPAMAVHVYEPSVAQIQAAEEVGKDKPRFCVTMQLARLDVANANGHRISLEEAEKALESLDGHPIPGNLDHATAAYGAATKLWIDKDGKKYPELMLEATYWTRYISEDQFDDIMKAYNTGKLGASWEIDPPFDLTADVDDPTVQDVKNFSFGGFGLMVSKEPAESATKGTASITASADDINMALCAEEADILASLDAAPLEYKQRQSLPDSDFALIRYSTDSDGNKIKERHFPIDTEARRKVVLAFLKKSKQFTTAEKIKVFKKTLARGKKEGDAWVSKYQDYNVNVFPPTNNAAAVRGGAIKVDSYGELPVDLLQHVPCPVCGSSGTLKRLEFEQGIFEMECRNGEYDSDKPTHRYEVGINVKAKGQAAEHQLVASRDVYGVERLGMGPDDIDEVGESISVVMRVLSKEVEDVAEYTDEQIEQMKKEAVEEALRQREEASKHEEDLEARVEAAVQERLERAKAEAVEAYKASLAKTAERLDQYEAIMPFESEEDREAFKASLIDMSDAEFTFKVELRKKDKEIADLKAAQAGDTDKDVDSDTESGEKLPAGKLNAGAEEREFDWTLLDSMAAAI